MARDRRTLPICSKECQLAIFILFYLSEYRKLPKVEFIGSRTMHHLPLPAMEGDAHTVYVRHAKKGWFTHKGMLKKVGLHTNSIYKAC